MKHMRILVPTLMVAAILMVSGCTPTAPDGPVAGLGGNTINKYVAIGNSLSAGYQSNGLYQSAQVYSFPNLIAQQLRLSGGNLGTFEMPWYSDPGSPDPATGKASRYEIISLTGPVIGPKGLAPGSPTNTALARPYDNLGVPGAVIFDFLDTTNFLVKAGPPRSNPMFALILRSSAYGKNMLAQAKALNPNLVTFWLGNNDVLGFATSGGVSPSAPTPSAQFAALFTQAMDSLKAALPNAKVAVGNIPDVRAIPFFTTVGPRAATLIPAGVWLRYQKHGNTGPAFDSTRLTEANPPLLTLVANSYAAYLGKPSGQWYRDKKYPALPVGIDTTKPFGFHPQNPIPDALVLDVDEQGTAGSAVQAFNATIASVAAAKGAALVDFNAFFSEVKAHGYYFAGMKFTSDYVSGGLFSLDGVHPSSRGHGVVANRFLEAINAKWGMSIPFVDVSLIPGIDAPIAKAVDGGMPYIPAEAFRSLEWLFGQGE